MPALRPYTSFSVSSHSYLSSSPTCAVRPEKFWTNEQYVAAIDYQGRCASFRNWATSRGLSLEGNSAFRPGRRGRFEGWAGVGVFDGVGIRTRHSFSVAEEMSAELAELLEVDHVDLLSWYHAGDPATCDNVFDFAIETDMNLRDDLNPQDERYEPAPGNVFDDDEIDLSDPHLHVTTRLYIFVKEAFRAGAEFHEIALAAGILSGDVLDILEGTIVVEDIPGTYRFVVDLVGFSADDLDPCREPQPSWTIAALPEDYAGPLWTRDRVKGALEGGRNALALSPLLGVTVETLRGFAQGLDIGQDLLREVR